MFNYLIRRLLLLPVTLFCILLVNFVIINLAPGDPTTRTEISAEGATRKADRSMAFGSDDRYLQFREHYGLTLPILFNNWPFTASEEVHRTIKILIEQKPSFDNPNALSVKDYDAIRITFGDQSRFIMPLLLKIIQEPAEPMEYRRMAARFFVRGATMPAFVGPELTKAQRAFNRKISKDTLLLTKQLFLPEDTPEVIDQKVGVLSTWYAENKQEYRYVPTADEKIMIFFFETRFFRYMSRVFTLDFGTLRNDTNKTVLNEVTRRFKYSLTLAIIPMIITFVLCQLLAFTMALYQGRWPDHTLNLFLLVLYAIPIFVAAPFLIEEAIKIHNFPFTDIPIPISGFTSPDAIYNKQTSLQRLTDTLTHLILPLTAIMYGSLAAQTRLSRTAVLEVLRQDYIRTAWAKGVPLSRILFKHVGRNAGITVVTSIAGSLGVLLGGSLIVETLFDINGFGKFFYDAVINRDYNVIMFSALAGSFLTLMGYLLADITYTLLDPRVTLD
ncbi:MAG: ABC transporter permease [Parachlamydiaceae bacterium]|nr:ABC transporter permease [Parachlamydiaceae bacterium]